MFPPQIPISIYYVYRSVLTALCIKVICLSFFFICKLQLMARLELCVVQIAYGWSTPRPWSAVRSSAFPMLTSLSPTLANASSSASRLLMRRRGQGDEWSWNRLTSRERERWMRSQQCQAAVSMMGRSPTWPKSLCFWRQRGRQGPVGLALGLSSSDGTTWDALLRQSCTSRVAAAPFVVQEGLTPMIFSAAITVIQ